MILTRFELERYSDQRVIHRADATLPRCKTGGVAKGAPPLAATPWGAELEANEADLARRQHLAYPGLPDGWGGGE